jgi:DNA repair exonuclease SbcCD ATPase subunit
MSSPIAKELAMSFLKFILSFFAPINQESLVIPAIPAPIPAPTAPQVNLTAALLSSAEAEIEKLKAELKQAKKANARLLVKVEDLSSDLEAVSAEVAGLKKANLHFEQEAHNMCAHANQRGETINELNMKLEEIEGDLVMANNWLAQALFRANDEARRADAYKAILLSQVARKSSNYIIPVISSDLTEEELNWRRRMTAAKFENFLVAYEYDVKPTGKTSVDKTDKHRGHRCGKTTMTKRETYHYLNR